MQIETLKKNKEFGRVYSRGKSVATHSLVLIYLPLRYGGIRVGFSVSKKVGGSVVRNKIRRRLKEAFRELLPGLKGNIHYVFVARQAAADADYHTLKKDMDYLLRKANKKLAAAGKEMTES